MQNSDAFLAPHFAEVFLERSVWFIVYTENSLQSEVSYVYPPVFHFSKPFSQQPNAIRNFLPRKVRADVFCADVGWMRSELTHIQIYLCEGAHQWQRIYRIHWTFAISGPKTTISTSRSFTERKCGLWIIWNWASSFINQDNS